MLVTIDSERLQKMQAELDGYRDSYERLYRDCLSAMNHLQGFCVARQLSPPAPEIVCAANVCESIKAALRELAGFEFEVKT